ncbi:MAG: hypothetical protein ACI30D_02665 [Muribaculaceae bacterium]
MELQNSENITKVCTKCGIEKPASEFYKSNIKKYGLQDWCKECKQKYAQIRRLKINCTGGGAGTPKRPPREIIADIRRLKAELEALGYKFEPFKITYLQEIKI